MADHRTQPAASVRSWRPTIAYYAAFIVLGLVVAVLGPTLPGLAQRTGSDLGAASVLFTTRSLGTFAGALAAGYLYDRLRGHPIIIVTLIALALFLALVPLASFLAMLALILLVVGFGEGIIDVGTNTLLVWEHGDRVPPFMNGLHFFFGVGAFISPIIIAQVLLRTDDVGWGFWLLALLILPTVLLFVGVPTPRPRAAGSGTGRGPTDAVLVFLVALFLLLYVGVEIGYGGWVYAYATELGLASATTAAYLTSAFWGAFTIGRLLSIPLAVYVSPRRLLAADIAGAAVSLGVILAFPASPTAVWIGSIGLGLALAAVFPTALSLAERRMAITGRITSWFFVGASLGAMTIPWLLGQLFTRIDPRATMVALLVDLGLVAVVFLLILRRSARDEAKATEASDPVAV